MRLLYNLLTYLLLIPFACYWVIRGIGNRNYLDRLRQRFGFGFPKLERCIWVHAVSVGEVQAAVPLVRALQKSCPDEVLLLTTVTPTGAARLRAVFGDTVQHCYIPFEFPHAVRNFFRTVNPRIAMIMETEIWPNLYRGCGIRDIPLVLVSARISPKSIPGYRRMLGLIRETLSHGIVIAAQSQADASRFLELGASSVRTWVTGNIKFDVETDPKLEEQGKRLRESLFGRRPVWVAASTHDGEETKILNVHQRLLQNVPDLMLVLIPRHPERFVAVCELVRKRAFNFVARTEKRPCDAATEVFVVDTMGEVPLFYATCDIAFVAGSLVPIGGHNLLEPAAQGLPIIIGPHVFNALDVAEQFLAEDACKMVADENELALAVERLLQRPEEARQLGDRALKVLEQNRGALQRLLELLQPLLDEPGKT